jgi:hypothetical protein
MSKILCNPYIWEDIRSVAGGFTDVIPPAHPCVSDLINTIVCWYSFAILLSGLLYSQYGVFTYSIYLLAFVTVLLLPSFVAYGRVTRTYGSPEPVVYAKEGFKPLIPTAQVETPAQVTYPTDRNPFMNVLLDEIKYHPTRPAAADIENKDVKLTLDDFFRVEFTSDPTDVFGRSQSQRQFITMPSTTIPNDQDTYKNWLYKIPGKTCKEGGTCLPGTDGGSLPWLNYNV